MPTAAPAKNPKTASLVVPEESFWKRYSGHLELPLAGMTSVFLHAGALVILVLGGLAFLIGASEEATRPVSMDVVQMDQGDGIEGGGGATGLPGEPGGGEKTEIAAKDPASTPTTNPEPDQGPMLKAVDSIQLSPLTLPEPTSSTKDDVAALLEKVNETAKDQARDKPADVSGPPKATTTVHAGGNGPGNGPGGQNGAMGRGGSGNGPGTGRRGPGTGSRTGGEAATRAQIFAQRWRFDLAGNARQHAEKLAAAGVILAFPNPQGNGFLVVTDLKRRPAEIRADSLAAYKDAVKWYNQSQESITSLATELQLPFTPKAVILLVPKEREEKIAEAEARYARQFRRDPTRITETHFDFRLTDGGYEPVVTAQH